MSQVTPKNWTFEKDLLQRIGMEDYCRRIQRMKQRRRKVTLTHNQLRTLKRNIRTAEFVVLEARVQEAKGKV